jgi:hypothetical protein
MYNILVFGLADSLDELRRAFEPSGCRMLCIDTATDFYAIAFSRVFDLWLMDGAHDMLSELALEELVNSHALPHLFIMTDSRQHERSWPAMCTSSQGWKQSLPKVS